MDRIRFDKQLAFIKEIDKIKTIFRQTRLFDNSRHENDAEHAWHLSMMVLILSEYANESSIDIQRIIKMVLIHDIVEIDVGDAIIYDKKANENKAEKEEKAAQRIFGMLPEDQKKEMLSLWHEFEERKTPEAKFAAAMDRIEPMLQNASTEGFAWKKHNIKQSQVLATNQHVVEGSEELWEYIKTVLQECTQKGYLQKN